MSKEAWQGGMRPLYWHEAQADTAQQGSSVTDPDDANGWHISLQTHVLKCRCKEGGTRSST